MIGNRRRKPFQTLFKLNLQQLTWLRETAKYLQTRVRRSNHGLESWAEQVREGFVLGFLEYHSPLLRLGVTGFPLETSLAYKSYNFPSYTEQRFPSPPFYRPKTTDCQASSPNRLGF